MDDNERSLFHHDDLDDQLNVLTVDASEEFLRIRIGYTYINLPRDKVFELVTRLIFWLWIGDPEARKE